MFKLPQLKIAAILFLGFCLSSPGTTLFPPMSQEVAFENAELVAQVKVLAIQPLIENGVTQKWASIITISILIKGVSAKTQASVLWNQHLANFLLKPKQAPEVGQSYKAYLRKSDPRTDFEPVHPDWGFVKTDKTGTRPRTSLHRACGAKRGFAVWIGQAILQRGHQMADFASG